VPVDTEETAQESVIPFVQNDKQQIFKRMDFVQKELRINCDLSIPEIHAGCSVTDQFPDFIVNSEMGNKAPQDRQSGFTPQPVEILIHEQVMKILFGAHDILGADLRFDRFEVYLTFFRAHDIPIGNLA
jgi:hypothetical protein